MFCVVCRVTSTQLSVAGRKTELGLRLEVLANVGRTTDEAANEYRQEHRMTLFGQEIPNPCLSLKEAGVSC